MPEMRSRNGRPWPGGGRAWSLVLGLGIVSVMVAWWSLSPAPRGEARFSTVDYSFTAVGTPTASGAWSDDHSAPGDASPLRSARPVEADRRFPEGDTHRVWVCHQPGALDDDQMVYQMLQVLPRTVAKRQPKC
ncbi:MAG: hypothetical protein KKA73_09260 [Chloroflexi bacterium]|nr:hypothetical protein [Chloroflexota bacterium]